MFYPLLTPFVQNKLPKHILFRANRDTAILQVGTEAVWRGRILNI